MEYFISQLIFSIKIKNMGIKIKVVNAKDATSFRMNNARNCVAKIPNAVKAKLKIHKPLSCLFSAISLMSIPAIMLEIDIE